MPKPAKKPTKKAAKTTRGRKPDAYPYPGADIVSSMRRHRKVSIVLAVVVGALLVWWGFNAIKTEVQFRQDKKQYAAAEASMADVYSQMVAAAGAPAESNSSKTCGHRSAKFEEGALYCGFGYDYFYEVNTPQEGIDLALKMINVLKSSNFAEDGSVPFSPAANPEWSRMYDFSYSQGRTFGCGFDYKLKEKEQHDELVAQNSSSKTGFKKNTSTVYAAEMDLGCHAGAMKPLYKVEE